MPTDEQGVAMPIRTNRGRAAVYRRLWGWPLRSPRHLVAAVIGVAVAATAIGMLLPPATKTVQLPSRQAVGTVTTQPLPAVGGAPTLATSQPTRLSSPPPPAPAAPAPEALGIATQWTTAWVNHPAGITTQQWLAGLRPFTTEEYLAVMATVDPANIQPTTVTGPPVAVNATASSVEANVPTDGGNITVRVIATQQGWRVSWYTKGG
jgi:hypothetical protein